MRVPEHAHAARLAALRAGDERAFADLVDELSPQMLKLARVYATGLASPEDAVQEAWLVVLNRESRSRPFSSLSTDDGPVIDPDRFLAPDHERWPGHWAIAPIPWPERALETAEAALVIRDTVATLPEAQRSVITLRDMIGCTPVPAPKSEPRSRRRSTPRRSPRERNGMQGARRGDHRVPR